MKKIILTSIALVIVIAGSFAQEKSIPRTEFTIALSSPSLEIKQGGTSDVTILLNRSKGYSKSNAVLTLSSGLPEGVSVTFEPSTGIIEQSAAKISVAETTKPGSYMLIVNGAMQHKNKGATLKLVVKESTGTESVTSVH
ncbi:MAG: hypothetical protein C0490_16820 [Marivirga sp.]|nr:hypothetical protein [Marivirga sp.]